MSKNNASEKEWEEYDESKKVPVNYDRLSRIFTDQDALRRQKARDDADNIPEFKAKRPQKRSNTQSSRNRNANDPFKF